MVTLFDGQELGSRLVILANGLNIGLRRELGMTREVVSESHSISIGFDMVPVGRHSFDFLRSIIMPSCRAIAPPCSRFFRSAP
jgi:hypothetical protein